MPADGSRRIGMGATGLEPVTPACKASTRMRCRHLWNTVEVVSIEAMLWGR